MQIAPDTTLIATSKLYENPNLPEQNAKFQIQTAQVHYVNGRYKEAYDLLYKTKMISDSLYGIVNTDRNNNIYSQKIAEENYEDYLSAERSKNRIQFWSFSSGMVALLIFLVFFTIAQRRTQKMKNQLDEFDKTSKLNIALLDEQSKQAKLDEQARLSHELHNTIAGDLVMLKHHLDSERMNFSTNAEIQRSLQTMIDLTDAIYTKARNKSHEWNKFANRDLGNLFSETVHKLIVTILPSYLKIDLEINNEAVQKISNEHKIELLKIIQEAIVNILKHSKASEIVLLIFELDTKLHITISDDGIGYYPKSKTLNDQKNFNALGQLVRQLNGTLEYKKASKGTVLEIILPMEAN